MDACQVSVAVGGEEEAGRVADALLEERLAACVQVIGPVHSRYWWRGERETALEWLCVAKTRQSLLDDLIEVVRAAHSHETPEILAVPVIGGDPAYLEWLAAETVR